MWRDLVTVGGGEYFILCSLMKYIRPLSIGIVWNRCVVKLGEA